LTKTIFPAEGSDKLFHDFQQIITINKIYDYIQYFFVRRKCANTHSLAAGKDENL
jgi:hypothetical protein